MSSKFRRHISISLIQHIETSKSRFRNLDINRWVVNERPILPVSCINPLFFFFFGSLLQLICWYWLVSMQPSSLNRRLLESHHKQSHQSPDDFTNYVSFLKSLKSALESSGHKYELFPPLVGICISIVSISQIIDWFNISYLGMTYDLHG